jgi:hypothetical protein
VVVWIVVVLVVVVVAGVLVVGSTWRVYYRCCYRPALVAAGDAVKSWAGVEKAWMCLREGRSWGLGLVDRVRCVLGDDLKEPLRAT